MTLEDLGRRAVACKHWRWMDGMVTFGFVGEDVPDLSDPATLGCLLALVREAWKGNVAPVYPDSDEALTKLVAALEAAP
jgi:hypothetical protein